MLDPSARVWLNDDTSAEAEDTSILAAVSPSMASSNGSVIFFLSRTTTINAAASTVPSDTAMIVQNAVYTSAMATCSVSSTMSSQAGLSIKL